MILCARSDRDIRHLERLRAHLRHFERTGEVSLFEEFQIEPGSVVSDSIAQAISRVSVAVLLITADFLAHDTLMTEQLPRLLERYQRSELRLLPVLVSACGYQLTPLGSIQPINPGRRSLTEMNVHERERLFERLAKAIIGREPLSLNDPLAVAGAVVTLPHEPEWSSLRGSSQGIQRQIDLLTHAKTVHDALHRVQFHVYSPVLAEEPRFPDDADMERLESASDELDKVITKLRGQESALAILHEILSELSSVAEQLTLATRGQDARALRKTISSLRRVLQRFPSKINGEIVSAVESLSIERLKAHVPMNASTLAAIVRELTTLSTELRFLNARHREWQAVEEDLMLAEAALGRQDEEIEDVYYPKSKACFDALCQAYATAPAGLALDPGCLEEANQRSISVEAAFNKKDPLGIRRCFSSYRRSMGKCFYKADDMLLKHCGRMQRAAMRLRETLEGASGGRHE
ncbi:MAG: toll/interleukin-1 receptor domain-containing protein [Myxococcales bacterium]|nr:toll/interleukin-1 receptor domain-containing protein [Myxococcales bacterium]